MQMTQLNGLERDLFDYFRPVDPDPDFINTLSRRLAKPGQTTLGHSNTPGKIWAVLGLGLIVGVMTLMLLTDRRKG